MTAPQSRSRFPQRRLLPLLLLPVLAALTGRAGAEVKLPEIFGDHMLLQEGATLPVWGWADPDEKVTVTLGDATGSAVAGADGTWRVDLPAVPQNTAPQVLTVAGKNTITIQDVLVGDVWVASGQSNMEFGINTDDRGAATIAQADEPQIRLFMAPHQISLEAKTDLAKSPGGDRQEGKWQVCSPATMGGKWGWNGFSAVAYYFAREIHHVTGRPIGIIETAWGGTPAQSWTSLSGLEKDPILAHYVADHQKLADNYAQATADYPKLKADFDAAMQQWNQEVGTVYNQAFAQWKTDAAQATASGQPAPPQPKPSRPAPAPVPAPDGGPSGPANLFNGMVAPLVPYAIKGVIWYQGEANAQNTPDYAVLFPRLITDWREKWGQGDFPFLYVQLAGFQAPQKSPSEGGWAWLRETQLQTLSVPNTGMATAVDIGNPFDIHPKDKLDVGLRLALAARRLAYGEDVVAFGPLYDTMTVDGNKIRLTFKEIGGGLTMGVPPWTPTGTPPAAPTELKGFAIAGADHKWVWAKAEVDGDAVVVSGDGVASPVAVRYDWANCPIGNLYNKEGLPASPFRTDDWDTPPGAPKPPAPAAPAP